MFEEFWPTSMIKQVINVQCGEHLSVRSIERYKQQHWQARRELVAQSSAALSAFQALQGEAPGSVAPAAKFLTPRFIRPSDELPAQRAAEASGGLSFARKVAKSGETKVAAAAL